MLLLHNTTYKQNSEQSTTSKSTTSKSRSADSPFCIIQFIKDMIANKYIFGIYTTRTTTFMKSSHFYHVLKIA
jgi:hypothetical protein